MSETQPSVQADPRRGSAQRLELLAPAGNWDCARAAVENGADAIYFGLDTGFNARARAANFHLDQLPQLMDMLHRQDVRGYVTLNTLVFTDELPKLEANLRHLAQAGVDAVIVQDLGAVQLIRRLCPSLTIHASTQMTLTNAAAIEMVRELGVARVVLARELSLREIQKIRQGTSMPLEVFVHGALCVAYSGQCLTSESLGGRSANRGQCAQACRLPYDLICDGQPRDLGPVRYLLSPQDLAAIELIPQLRAAGVCSLKIEGRLKTAEYVANVCQQYRRAIEQAESGAECSLTREQKFDLEMSFSRGLSPGWLEGCDHKRLVPGESSSKRGVQIGKIVLQRGPRVTISLAGPLSIGDGIVFEGDRLAGDEIGGRVYEMWQGGSKVNSADSGDVQIALQHGLIDRVQLPSHSRVFKTDDPQLTKRLRKSFESADPQKRVPIDLKVKIEVGQPIQVSASVHAIVPSDHQSDDTIEIQLVSSFVPEVARKHPIDRDKLHEQLSRLGGTVYRLNGFEVQIEGNPMVPLSVLGDLRRQLVEKLNGRRTTPSLSCEPGEVAKEMINQVGIFASATERNPDVVPHNQLSTAEPELRVLCRSLVQLQHVLQSGAKRVVADFHDLRQYTQAIELAANSGASIELATLRIHKPGEDGLFHSLKKMTLAAGQAVTWLVRSLAGIHYCRQHQIQFSVDFSLNVTNPLTFKKLIDWGAQRVTASYDLNRDQLIELASACPGSRLEVVVHQHMPMFHMEHCVFCSVLSPGKNKSDCGRPCDRHDVKLRDRVGAEHVLHADIGCRNTLYNASAQSGAEAVAPLIELGVRHFRIELLRDLEAVQAQRLVELYLQLVQGQIQGSKVWQELKADNRIGVTRGTLEQPRNPLAIL